MTKYGVVALDIRKGNLVNFDELRQPEKDILINGNIIYIYRGTRSRQIYIGQSKHFIERNKQHYDGNEEKFENAGFNEVIILYSVYFNGSALDDVESQLITFFNADNPKTSKNRVQFNSDSIINLTSGNSVNDYRDRDAISSEVILPFWENYLAYKGWVTTLTLNEVRERELTKYSPIKALTNQQIGILNEIISNSTQSYIINGDAGTGKTVMLTHLVAKFLHDHKNKRIAVVVQPNWEKTATNIFNVYGMNSTNLTIATSTKLINTDEKYDVIIVDESHKLSRKFSKQMASFNKVYESYPNEDNHLEILKQLSNQLVLMYDVLQAIRPANMTRGQFEIATQGFEKRYLTTQFRIQTPKGKNYTSEDYINGVKYILYKDTNLLKETNFNPEFDKSVFYDQSKDAYFGFFENEPLLNITEWIDEDRNFNPTHIDRILGGLVEEWKQSDGKEPSIKHWHEGNIHRRWNSTQTNWVNISDEDAEDQIGSVFAVQGIDLNKVGVLIGNDLQVDEDGKLFGNQDNFYNINGKFPQNDDNPTNEQEFTLFVLNIYYILMTRGIDGIRLGFWHNEEFKQYIKKVLEIE